MEWTVAGSVQPTRVHAKVFGMLMQMQPGQAAVRVAVRCAVDEIFQFYSALIVRGLFLEGLDLRS
eukprot:SAG11_NODE_12024_length_725_cov_1.249201_1_plen_65_part_00